MNFMRLKKRLTLEGNIVISVDPFGHAGNQEVWDGMDEEHSFKVVLCQDKGDDCRYA